jgi:periplasmic divalent cation tolerance protein
MQDLYIIITKCPDRDSAGRIARLLVEQRLAACVNILNACTSIYRWQGAVETADEVPLLIKTRAGLFEAVERLIRQHHPYELPEILAVGVDAGSADYVEWVAGETGTGR